MLSQEEIDKRFAQRVGARLNLYGADLKNLDSNDSQMSDKISAFQKARGLKVTGTATRSTMKLLMEDPMDMDQYLLNPPLMAMYDKVKQMAVGQGRSQLASAGEDPALAAMTNKIQNMSVNQGKSELASSGSASAAPELLALRDAISVYDEGRKSSEVKFLLNKRQDQLNTIKEKVDAIDTPDDEVVSSHGMIKYSVSSLLNLLQIQKDL